MLSGDNGLLTRTTDAKEKTGKAEVVENAKLDVLAQIAENKGETISETQLKAILGKYFEEFTDELSEDLSETTITLTAKETYGGYNNIALASIYNGKILKAKSQDIELTYEISEDDGDVWLSIYPTVKGYNVESNEDMEVTITFNGSNETINLLYDSGAGFDIENSGTFEVTAIASNGKEGTTIVTIDKFYVLEPVPECEYETYGEAAIFELKRFGSIIPILSEYSPKMKIEGVENEFNENDELVLYNGTLNITSLTNIYSGKNATITLNINGEEVKWTGVIGDGPLGG